MPLLVTSLPFLVWASSTPQAPAIFCVFTYQKFPAVVRLCLVFLLEVSLTALAVSGATAEPAYLLPSPTTRESA